MKNILVLSGSSKPNSAGENLLPVIKSEVESHEGLTANVVDVRTLNLPFFNETSSPSTEGFVPTDANAKSWTEQLAAADAIVLLTPEYNGSLSAIQKNAIDWGYSQWFEKPVSLVGYGWGGAKRAHDNARIVLSNVKANVLPESAHISFMEQLSPSGEITNLESVTHKIKATIDELANSLA
jgi:NAD(P)H-dependent FMN reductase